MHLNFQVVQQWLSLILGLRKPDLQHIDNHRVQELLGQYYLSDGIWIQEAIYVPELNVLQVVAVVTSANYIPEASHVTKEQYIRVQTQAGVLCAMLSEQVPEKLRKLSSKEFSANLYYRMEKTRWRRLVQPNDPFVCQFRVTARSIQENTAFTIDMSDGPFDGQINAVYVTGHSTAEAEEGLEQACYSTWQSIVDSIVSRIAFSILQRRNQWATRILPMSSLRWHC